MMGSRKRDSSEERSPDAGEPPAKQRRTSRACIQCRTRKQKCDGPSQSDPMLPCRRCTQLNFTCSFTTTPPENITESHTIANTIQKVGKLQKQMVDHQKRILELEQALSEMREERIGGSGPQNRTPREAQANDLSNDAGLLLGLSGEGTVDGDYTSPTTSLRISGNQDERPNIFTSAPPSPPPTDPGFTMDAVGLDTPMSTLRNISSLSKDTQMTLYDQNMTYHPILPLLTRKECQSFDHDPIIQGVLSEEEAQQAFDVFFTHCHSNAPFICSQTQRSAAHVRQTSPTLFLSICVVGARFWETANSQLKFQALHPRYPDLVSLLDTSVSRLLLQPSLSDVNIDHIQSLLLYIQWMPVEQHTPGISQTRYNDISAWSVLGLAIRYALFLGLDRTAPAPFSPTYTNEVTREDFTRLRVWINLLTCDYHLMLSAGLPASLDPDPTVKIGRAFAQHNNALQPDDSRIAALSELVGVVKRAAQSSGDPSVRVLDTATLKKANAELDNWELYWTSLLNNNFLHHQMPFTSFRWYRLALNSTHLRSILSPPKHRNNLPPPQSPPLQLPLLVALDNSILAAAQTILALSAQTTPSFWPIQSQSISSFPTGPFTISEEAITKFRFAVDSAWITHSFAPVFLVLCYTRGAVDENLQILSTPPLPPSQTYSTPPPNPTSLFHRLITLASQIFDTICRTSAAHPAADYRSIVHNVFSVILRSPEERARELREKEEGGGGLEAWEGYEGMDGANGNGNGNGNGNNGFDMGGMDVDGLFELMVDAGFGWQGGLFGVGDGEGEGM